MNTIWIVLPILTLLMFDLGLTLRLEDFTGLARQPRAVVVGLTGQLLLLPLVAFALGEAFSLEPVYYIGLVLIACCPGGSSSNVFSKLAGGDVALSVTLTALSSLITLLTIPVVMGIAVARCGGADAALHLPVGNLVMQNIVLMAVPIIIGCAMRYKWPNVAASIDAVLARLAFPALMLLAGLFFVGHRAEIIANFGQLGACLLALNLVAAGTAATMARLASLDSRQRRTIVIEVGMQNAAQAIAMASSPLVFDNEVMAIPAIVYALLMNVVLLTYVAVLRRL